MNSVAAITQRYKAERGAMAKLNVLLKMYDAGIIFSGLTADYRIRYTLRSADWATSTTRWSFAEIEKIALGVLRKAERANQ